MTFNILFYYLFYLFIIYLAALGLHCCRQAFSGCIPKQGQLFAHTSFSLQWLFSLQSTALGTGASVVVAHELSCSAACRIFPDQGSNLLPLTWQADSYPLYHQGSSSTHYF